MKMNLVSFLNLRPGAATCAASICSNTSSFYTDSKLVNGNTILNSIACYQAYKALLFYYSSY